MVQMRVVEVCDDFFERVGVDFSACDGAQAGCQKPATTLNDKQLRTLLEAVQANERANILSAPRLVLIDGQTGTFQVCQSQVFQTGVELVATPSGVVRKPRHQTVETGITTTIVPKVSADGRSVTLRLNYRHADLNPAPVMLSVTTSDKPGVESLSAPCVDIQTVESTMALPDGGTGLVLGPVLKKETRVEHAPPPVVSRVPYVNRLFKTAAVGTETRRQIILVTPKVLCTSDCAKPACETPCCPVAVEPPKPAPPKPVSAAEPIVARYRKACAEGRTEEAMRLAMLALAQDPKCFATEK
jgi:type II secretory pathway component GspD/PulD (secretin)